MDTPELESKRIFLIACRSETLAQRFNKLIEQKIRFPTVFISSDGAEALFKADNVVPHVAILEADLSKKSGFVVAEKLVKSKKDHPISVILVSPLPEQDFLVDHVATGQIQFLAPQDIEGQFTPCLTRALNAIAAASSASYRMKFLSPHQILFNEGDRADSVFIVKSGELVAYKKGQSEKEIVLGKIKPGEFVGEMAHFNDAIRSATVKAESSCELIEIPSLTLDLVLFSKPVWAKALVSTLSKRLQISNTLLVNRTSS